MPIWLLVLLLFLVTVGVMATATAGARRAAAARPARARAWELTEGSELPGDVVVLQVHREPLLRTVDVLTDDPGRAVLRYGADDMVDVVRLAR